MLTRGPVLVLTHNGPALNSAEVTQLRKLVFVVLAFVFGRYAGIESPLSFEGPLFSLCRTVAAPEARGSVSENNEDIFVVIAARTTIGDCLK